LNAAVRPREMLTLLWASLVAGADRCWSCNTTLPPDLGVLRLDTRDQNGYAFRNSAGVYTTGRFTVIGRTSLLQTRVRGQDDRVWASQSVSWPTHAATTVRAALGTQTIAKPQKVNACRTQE
jgi:hypothetical protein